MKQWAYDVDHDPAVSWPWRVIRVRDVDGVTVREMFAHFKSEGGARVCAEACAARANR